MTLPPFDLHRVGSSDEARELLERYGEDAAVVCGGTELLLLLKLGFAAYGHLVDIKGIDDLGADALGADARAIERTLDRALREERGEPRDLDELVEQLHRAPQIERRRLV